MSSDGVMAYPGEPVIKMLDEGEGKWKDFQFILST